MGWANKDLRRSASVMTALREAREAKGWSMSEMARVTGFDEETILRWERLKTSPRLEKLIEWARALDLNIMVMKTGDKE